MVGISKLTIRGFQSHVDSCFSLAPGLTVITGPSDAGKTAVIRALRWLAFNEPQGDGFLHTLYNADGSMRTQAEQAEVTVELTNGVVVTKTRRKGKTTYTHSLYPEPWEKAEVPQEIKEALGLEKQSYGDFETCLNFAFQLDPPFLLSETGSVGAKVLGKLAGTEVVDKAIGAINKQTHHARAELAQAEKTVGQLDVELLEYLQVDAQYTVLEALEAAFTLTEQRVSTQATLSTLNGQHAALVDRVRSLHDKLCPLECVAYLTATLQNVSRDDQRRDTLTGLTADFWKAVEVCRATKQTLNRLEDLADLQRKVTSTATAQERVVALNGLRADYLAYQNQIALASSTAANADRILQQKDAVALLCDNVLMLSVFQTYAERHRTAVGALTVLSDRVTALQSIEALQGKIEGLQVIVEKLGALNGLLNSFKAEREKVEEVGEKVGILRFEITIANGELQEAWDETGGVCPMCGQAVERRDTECEH